MTYEEAVNTINIAIAEVEWSYPTDYVIALEKARDALEKQIPQKLIKKHDNMYSPFETRSYGYVYICPICKNDTCGIKSLYCPLCGQRLE